jgi:hypothetical protein
LAFGAFFFPGFLIMLKDIALGDDGCDEAHLRPWINAGAGASAMSILLGNGDGTFTADAYGGSVGDGAGHAGCGDGDKYVWHLARICGAMNTLKQLSTYNH